MRNVATTRKKASIRAVDINEVDPGLPQEPERRGPIPFDLNPDKQLRAVGRVALLVYLPGILILSIALIQNMVPVPDLFRDLTTVEDVPFYAGFYSQLGAVFWACSVGVCFLTWSVLRKTADGREWQTFFLAAGVFTAVLLFDDLYLWHEEILPMFIPHGQTIMYVIYAAGAFGFLIRFWKQLLSTNYGVLIVAMAFLGISVAIDVWSGHWIPVEAPDFTRIRIFFEDGAKFLGILGWLTYFAGAASTRLGILLKSR